MINRRGPARFRSRELLKMTYPDSGPVAVRLRRRGTLLFLLYCPSTEYLLLCFCISCPFTYTTNVVTNFLYTSLYQYLYTSFFLHLLLFTYTSYFIHLTPLSLYFSFYFLFVYFVFYVVLFFTGLLLKFLCYSSRRFLTGLGFLYHVQCSRLYISALYNNITVDYSNA